MAHAPQEITFKLATPNDDRITRLGAILRKSKIDELPQLFNILKGEMSFVGPRPELEIFVNPYRKDFEEILQIRPGLTDLASIKFKNEEDLHENSTDPVEDYISKILPAKILIAKEYIRKQSFLLDCKIILKTLTGFF